MRAMIRAASMGSGCPAAVYMAMTAIQLETGGWRDEWLVADGAARNWASSAPRQRAVPLSGAH